MTNINFGSTAFHGHACIKINAKLEYEVRLRLQKYYPELAFRLDCGKKRNLTQITAIVPLEREQLILLVIRQAIIDSKIIELRERSQHLDVTIDHQEWQLLQKAQIETLEADIDELDRF